MKNTKSIIAVIIAAVIICASFAACKANEETVNKNNVSESDTVSVNASVPEGKTSDIASEATTEKKTSEETTASTTKVETTVKETTTKKKVVTTTKKNTSENTTKKKASTTKKQTTTKKVTTTKPKTTVKNVTPKEVQNKVNAYIKSKGIPVDASRTPNNSGWSGRIARPQVDLNNGHLLKTCKGYVDAEIDDGVDKMYCYYDSNWFYILYV